ncbi:MAG: hypothetical protein RMI79_07260, partial [Nitrososphaerota archaeon]|nr:hypothetical protein [Nitrososphaerota archaeon]
GQRRIVSILRATSGADVHLLLLDEIYIGLSPRMCYEVYKLINNFIKSNSHVGVIATAQRVEQLENLAFDKILVMRRGRIVGDFTSDKIDLQEIYKLIVGLA